MCQRSVSAMYYIVMILIDAFTETGLIKPVYEVVRYLLNKCISFLTNVLTSSFRQSMIARLVLNLLKSREILRCCSGLKLLMHFLFGNHEYF